MVNVLWTITVVLVLFWALGFAINIGAWINFLLMVAIILVIFNVISWASHRSGSNL
jgi:hypothetical protein